MGAKAKVEKAALELFAANGVDGVSIGEVAARAGVSQGALHRHYRSKEELAWNLFATAYLRTGAEPGEILGVILQTAVFLIYGRLEGALAPRAASLTRAAIAAVEALGQGEP